MNTNDLKWISQARYVAAQCWCQPKTRRIQMDFRLAEAFAVVLAAWMEKAAHHAPEIVEELEEMARQHFENGSN